MVKSNCRTTNKKTNLRKGSWSPDEDQKLIAYVNRYGIWNWAVTPMAAGLLRCGKSCRLRWMNYLRPGIKRGNFSQEEDETIINLHRQLGNRWSTIASKLPGRTDNEIKNHWHTYLKKYIHLQGNQSVNPENPSESDDGSHCNGSTPLMSSQPSFNNFSSSSSCDSAGEIYNNQITIEERNGSSVSSNEEANSLWDLTPFPIVEGIFTVDDYAQPSFDDFCSPSSCGPAAENSYRELQSLWDHPFPMAGLYTMDDYGATYTDPGLLVSTSQWGFQEDTYTFASCDDANDGLWAYLLKELNEERV